MKKLNEVDCNNICNEYLSGVSYKILSKKYNISTWSVGNILKKKTTSKVEFVNINVMRIILKKSIPTKKRIGWVYYMLTDMLEKENNLTESINKAVLLEYR
jgi:hypothetical protein